MKILTVFAFMNDAFVVQRNVESTFLFIGPFFSFGPENFLDIFRINMRHEILQGKSWKAFCFAVFDFE